MESGIQFVCADCGAHVWDFSGAPVQRSRCSNCQYVRSLNLPPDEETELREMLGVELQTKTE